MLFSGDTPEDLIKKFNKIDNMIKSEAAAGFEIPVQELVTDISTIPFNMKLVDDPNPVVKDNTKKVTIKSIDGLEKHIKIKDGKMPATGPIDGVYEVLVTERALNFFGAVLDSVFVIENEKVKTKVKIKPVGIFEKAKDDDPFFRFGNLGDLDKSAILPFETAEKHLMKEQKVPVAGAGWYIVLDYSKMELRHIPSYEQSYESIRNFISNDFTAYRMGTKANAHETIAVYTLKAENLYTLMWALNIPVLIMLAFYMFMIANLLANRQKTEIAVLRSRGAARWQIIASNLLEIILLCGIALALGPLLGAVFTKVLGASSGFMEFVQRVGTPVRIVEAAYQYGLFTALCCLLISIIPIIAATRVSIVDHKKQMARMVKTPLWHKIFLDIIALGLSIYGLFTFRKWLADLQKLDLETTDLAIDPLQFIVPALFIMGLGLLLLRFYPWILKIVYWMGKKWWPPSYMQH